MSIHHIGYEHGRSGTGCWAAFTYREAGFTFRMSECDTTSGDYEIEIEGPTDGVPLGVMARAIDALDPLTMFSTAYRSKGEGCSHYLTVPVAQS